jgi:hypothetical protein
MTTRFTDAQKSELLEIADALDGLAEHVRSLATRAEVARADILLGQAIRSCGFRIEDLRTLHSQLIGAPCRARTRSRDAE